MSIQIFDNPGKLFLLVAVVGLGIMLTFLPGGAVGNSIEYRKELMKSVGKSAKRAGAAARGTVFDPSLAGEAISTIHRASKEISQLFPKGTEAGSETEASPKIWQDRAGFEVAAKVFEVDAQNALRAIDEGQKAFAVAFGKLARNCKSCHESYRIKK